MSDNVNVTPGTGNVIAADEIVDGTLGTVKVQYVKLMDGTIDGTTKAAVGANGLKIDGSGVTQPISASTLPLPSGAATSANQTTELSTLSTISSALTNKTQFTQLTDGTDIAVISASGALSVDINAIGANALGQEAMAASIPVVIASNQTSFPVTVANPVQVAAANLVISTTAATGVAVTATLPAVASQFHYITLIEIVKYFTVANAASATPLVVTTTNLPGSLAFTFGQPVGTIGSTDIHLHVPTAPLKSSVVNTATTIVCPATTGILWRVNIYYFTAS